MIHYILTNRKLNGGEISDELVSSEQLSLLQYDSTTDAFTGHPVILDEGEILPSARYLDLKKIKELSDLFASSDDFKEFVNIISNKRVMVYIHGVFCKIKTLKEFLKGIEKNYGLNKPNPPFDAILAISWPSRSFFSFAYQKERIIAEDSGKQLALFAVLISELVKNVATTFGPNRKLFAWCQSSGNLVFEYMIEEILRYNNQSPFYFDKVILAGADIHYDVFYYNSNNYSTLAELTNYARSLRVIYNPKDRALKEAKKKMEIQRLGLSPKQPKTPIPNLSFVDIRSVDGNTIVDVDEVFDAFKKLLGKNDERPIYNSIVNHWYTIYDPDAVKLVKDYLKE